MPSYTERERGHLSDVASAPTAADLTGSPFGVLSVTLLAAVALWGVALITYLATRPLPAGIRTSREPTWRIIVRAARPGAIAAASAALVISVIAVPLLDLKATTAVAFLLVSLLAAGSFVAINQALAAVLGSAGRLLSLVLGVLAVATGVVTTIPGPLYASAGLLPTHGAVVALRALVTGGSGVVTGLVELLAWLAIGFLATVLVTDRRRYLSPRDLRLGTVPSAPSLG